MKEPWLWLEEDIQTLIRTQRKEDLQLEYKKSDALAKGDAKRVEIAKDVAAMANSAGGVIIYGLDEQKKTGGPLQLDAGIDPDDISIEWLEQVLDSGVHRRINNLRVHRVRMSATGKYVYVVCVPQSIWAPHMASDHRYHKRLGTTTAQMEEYEVRDVARRSESPDLHLDLRVGSAGPGSIQVHPRLTNRSAEPVLYASIRLYAEEPMSVKGNVQWSSLDNTEMIWDDTDRISFSGVRFNWSVPKCHPILEGEYYDLYHINMGFQLPISPGNNRYRLGWEVRTPKAAPKLCGLKLTLDNTGAHIDGNSYALAAVP